MDVLQATNLKATKFVMMITMDPYVAGMVAIAVELTTTILSVQLVNV